MGDGDAGRVVDDSPRGSGNAVEQQSPTPDWVKISTSDDNSICYVAFTAAGDFVDAQNRDTGHRKGADVNRRFNLGTSLDGHEKMIKSRTVFDAFKSFLNRNPPPPATISVDKDSGSYGGGLEVRVTVAPATVPAAGGGVHPADPGAEREADHGEREAGIGMETNR